MPLRESSAYDPTSPNRIPPSMGPGARPIDATTPSKAQTTALERARQQVEIRKDYHYEIHDDSMSLSYKIDNAQRQYNLPFDSLPVSPSSRKWTFGNPIRSKEAATRTTDIIRQMETTSGRRPTQTEAEGLAFHTLRSQERTGTLFRSAFIVGALYSFRRGRELKFPFRKKKPIEQYQNFPSWRMPIVRGRPAVVLWHGLRVMVYGLLCVAGSSVFLNGYTNSTMMVGMYRDPRTHQLFEDAAAKQKSMPSGGYTVGLPGTTPAKTTSPVAPGQDSDDQGFGGAADADYGGGQGASFESFATPSETAYADSSTTDTNVMDDTAGMSQPETTQSSWRTPRQQTSKPSTTSPYPSQQQQQQQNSQDSSDYFLGSSSSDPNSPSYNGDNDASPSSTPVTNRGSVWSRIRQQQPQAQSQSSQRGSSPTYSRKQAASMQYEFEDGSAAYSDTYSSSPSAPAPPSSRFSRNPNPNQNQNQDKSAAQREFDEMLERERRGVGGSDASQTSRQQGQQFASGYDDGGSTTAGGENAWENRRRR